jgi:hypothetical protein
MDMKPKTYNASLRTDLIKKLTVLADELGVTPTELLEEATLNFFENLRMEGQEIRAEEFNGKKPEEITDGFKCPRDCVCHKSGLEVLCKAKAQSNGPITYVECLEDMPQDCVFSRHISGTDTRLPLHISCPFIHYR